MSETRSPYTAEPRVYAVSERHVSTNITAGKRYKVSRISDEEFVIIDDDGDWILCNWRGCRDLRGVSWTRVEEPAPVEEESELDRLRAENAALRKDNRRLRHVIERDRTAVAQGVARIKSAIGARAWMRATRGCYAYDDNRFFGEFGEALDEVEASLEPLRAIGHDWSDCLTNPTEIAEARAALASGEAQPDG